MVRNKSRLVGNDPPRVFAVIDQCRSMVTLFKLAPRNEFNYNNLHIQKWLDAPSMNHKIFDVHHVEF